MSENMTSNNENTTSQTGNGLVSRAKEKFKKVISNITIEPCIFLIIFSSDLDEIASSQMVILKSCKNDFPEFNDTICDNLNSPEFQDANVMVSNELNQFNVYKKLILSIFPIFFSFYLGAWSDLFGRKFLFYTFLTAFFLEQVILLFCAYYFDSPKVGLGHRLTY